MRNAILKRFFSLDQIFQTNLGFGMYIFPDLSQNVFLSYLRNICV